MTVKISKPAIDVREKLSELDKPSGIAGEAMLRADTPAEQFELINAGRRNLLINSLFEINQRGITSVSGTSGQQKFTADRWLTYGNGVSMDATIQTATLPNGITTKTHKTTATSSGSSFLHPYQKVETLGLECLAGQTVTLSSWVRTTVPNQTLRICDTHTCYTLGSEIPSDGEWHFVTGSHTLPDSADFDSGAGDFIQFHPSFGTADIVSGMYIEFALPQLEVGKIATPFEHRSYGEELALCQRYYQTSQSTAHYYNSLVYNTTSVQVQRIILPVEMRTAPTVSFSEPSHITTAGNWGIYNSTNGWSNAPGYTPNAHQMTSGSFGINFSNVGGVQSHEALLASGGWAADAEL